MRKLGRSMALEAHTNMQLEAVGFWGAFFGCAAIALVAALLAFTRSARRVAFTGALAAATSAAYTLVFLGWVPFADREALQRLQALTAIASAAVLALLLFMLLGTFRRRETARRIQAVVGVLALAAAVLSHLMPPEEALRLAVVICIVITIAAFFAGGLSARRGERTGWLVVAALICMCVGMAGVDWYAFHPHSTPWPVHAAAAVGAIAYLVCIGTAIGIRYAYLIEVSKVMTHGPQFDPVTSMPSYESGQAMNALFDRFEREPCGLLVVSISNLKMLEELHGRAAYNHALFVCASRLRRMALPGADLARLREDAFLLVIRLPRDVERLIEHARLVMQRLARPVTLGTSREITALEESGAVWQPSLGIGVLLDEPGADPAVTVAGARAMSRTAWSYPSRMAWYDEAAGEIAELPATG